ncbi:reverse transcriptase (RNA-dependent DNA polymerase) [Hirsutella rhossiliensis]|uniref:Reverse transcriptase (RNA-dependent DNA polymerase) domain-containing protein n=1 Tax=Hirsutella rhossiliensis TaxID=111463 RepID=A0A9P8NBH4_9HYPO|nr:reverse transcriptase (RNA-dependent DNA polymerase) domain-containing protein [Hirsutella rhossiliensis]KAH0968112.1 reverse transcriptase (RNA-dependent DNA polymerase) domain-containing protein [Hirsutella rhossiliensis]
MKDTLSGPTSPLESASTYAASRQPSRLTDLRGVEINFDEAVKEEIACQTGLKPISIRTSRHDSGDMPTKTLIVSFLEPTQRPWRLFGASRFARYIDKPSIPSQCDKCWDFHSTQLRSNGALQALWQTGHRSQECTALEQCANCLGPHCADDPKCPARPKRVHGMVRRLTKEEKSLAADTFLESTAPRAAGGDGSSDMGAIYEPAAPSTPCIVVATTPPHSCDATLMPRCFPRNRSDRRILRIFQANVGKIPPAHDCALALADSEQYDIILLQEPWTGLKDGRCLTKTHQAYDTFSPVNDWDGRDTRPRVMTYVRRSAGLVADQKRPAATRDILWLTVNGITVVNFYRQPYHDGALEILLQWTVPDKCLVAGDFNAKHPSWQAGRREDRGEEIAFWAMDNRLGLLNPVDVPTNAHGNTVDLAFCNIPLADAVVEDHLATGSDHFTLSITLPGQVLAPLPIGKIHLNSDEELKRFIELVEAGAAFIPITTASPSELDSFASALVNLLGCAARAAGRPARKTTHGARWWTEECAKAAANYRAWRRVHSLFDREVQLAKRSSIAWCAGPSAFTGVRFKLLLQIDDRVYETQLEKATALRQATLERRTANDDIPDPWISVNTDRTIPFTDRVSPEETRDATLRTGNTSLVPTILRIGHHPKPFREAEVVMIAKPGRRDLYTPRLAPHLPLSCLGKGLERLIARRLAWASVHFGVLHPQQAGALPKRSAVDLVAALIHDIEEAFACKQVATLVTLDIQGAFDTVLRNRLILRLREQGWPPNLARWVGSFMQDRSARIRYQDIATNSSPLQCGLPQGSPVSPILFLLYTEPIYRLGSSKGRFGYADDTAILCVGDSLDETSAEASHHVRELVSWGAANGISFDPEKTEVMHFSRTTPKTAPPVLHGEFEKRPGRAMRWLGVWLDSTLSFKTHVEKWTAKAQAVAFHLRRLTNTRHGPLPSAVRRAVCACVIPVLLYAAEVWYPGSTRPRWTKPGKEGPSRIGHLVKKMSKALYTSLRAILPVWRTTPTNVLHREAGIPPVPLLLEARRTAFAARLKSLDEAHPLVKRTSRPKAPTE